MSNMKKYKLPVQGTVVTHYRSIVLMTQDQEETLRELDAYVRSGDYFITLATMLEAVLDQAEHDSSAVKPMIDKLIQDLEYLQKHYIVVKRPKKEY